MYQYYQYAYKIQDDMRCRDCLSRHQSTDEFLLFSLTRKTATLAQPCLNNGFEEILHEKKFEQVAPLKAKFINIFICSKHILIKELVI